MERQREIDKTYEVLGKMIFIKNLNIEKSGLLGFYKQQLEKAYNPDFTLKTVVSRLDDLYYLTPPATK